MKMDEKKLYSPIREIIEKALALNEELRRIDEEEKEILDQINKLSTVKGTLVYKWVKNKIGKKYWYWYLHVKEKGRTRSIYIGSTIPKEIVDGIENRRKLQLLQNKLKILEEHRERILDTISKMLKA